MQPFTHSVAAAPLVRDGARASLTVALQAGVAVYTETFADRLDQDGHWLVVWNGYHVGREVTTAAGAVVGRPPRVNDKRVGPVTGAAYRDACNGRA